MFGGGYASPPLAQTAKVNVDFSEIDHLGSGGSTGDRCLQDTGEGGFGRYAPRANLVGLKKDLSIDIGIEKGTFY